LQKISNFKITLYGVSALCMACQLLTQCVASLSSSTKLFEFCQGFELKSWQTGS